MANFLELQDKIGYEFKQEKLLRQALTHSSFANEKHLRKHSDNELSLIHISEPTRP